MKEVSIEFSNLLKNLKDDLEKITFRYEQCETEEDYEKGQFERWIEDWVIDMLVAKHNIEAGG